METVEVEPEEPGLLRAKDASLTSEAIIEYCKSHLARFKVPKAVKLLDKLPRNAMGKLVLKDLPDRETM